MSSSADMEQVREFLGLIKGVKTNDGLVAGEAGDAVEGRSARASYRAIRSVCLVQHVKVYEAL